MKNFGNTLLIVLLVLLILLGLSYLGGIFGRAKPPYVNDKSNQIQPNQPQ